MRNQTKSSPVNYSSVSKRRIGLFTKLAVERSIENRFFHTSEGQSWLLKALETVSLNSIASVLNLSKKPDVWFILIDETLPLPMRGTNQPSILQSRWCENRNCKNKSKNDERFNRRFSRYFCC